MIYGSTFTQEDQALIQYVAGFRTIYANFRKQTGLNKSQLEVLAVFNAKSYWSTDELQNTLPTMNIQQLRGAIRCLYVERYISQLREPKRGLCALYIIQTKGLQALHLYTKLTKEQLSWL